MASECFKCSICLEYRSACRSEDYFVSTPGGHVFHYSCIKKLIDGGNNQCPMCREHVGFNNLTRLYGIDPNLRHKALSPKASNSTDTNRPDYTFKLVLLGSSSVGKSSIMQRFTTGIFRHDLVATTGCDLCFRTMEMGGKLIKLSMWDTVGQEKFRSVATNCVRNAHGVMLVYDVSDSSSFIAIDSWLQFIEDYGPSDAVKILIGNKVDVDPESKMVTQRQGKVLASKLSLSFFETSAKDANNVEAAFRCLVGEIMERTVLNPNSEDYDDPNPPVSGCRLHIPYQSYDEDFFNSRGGGLCLC